MSNVNIFMKLTLKKGGVVKGSSSIDGHLDEIVVDSFSWGEQNAGIGGEKGEKATLRAFSITKKMCPASVQLLLACATNDRVNEAVISCRLANTTEKVDFLKWTLTDGAISNYQVEATAKDSVIPGEHVDIRFQTLSVEFRPKTPEGKLGATLSGRVDVNAAGS
ncbi:MAG: type VI secretion system tube protein Hcp [Planctomycetes bacterium]|nr:type VI secretion system tube protein Hcp [Planctomycetota bacterium]